MRRKDGRKTKSVRQVEVGVGPRPRVAPGAGVDRGLPPEGGKMQELTGMAAAFTPEYAPEEMFEIATKLYKASR